MLDIVIKTLKEMDRTPAWLCRQAGVHRSNFTRVKNGYRNLSEDMMDKFSEVLGIRKEILFNNKESNNESNKNKR